MTCRLPIEIIEKITCNLSNHGKIQCLLTCKAWYSQLYRILLRKVTLYCRRELLLFLSLLQTYDIDHFGRHVREFYLKNGVGLTCQEVLIIGKYCTLLEVFKFDHWRYYKRKSFTTFRHLKQMPKLTDLKKGTSALEETRNSLTHLEMDTIIVQELLTQNRLLDFLAVGANLTHLTLEGIFRISHTRARANTNLLEFNYKTWQNIHVACPHLVSITTDNTIFTATSEEAEIMSSTEELVVIPQMTELGLSLLRMEHPAWISYFAKKYPNLKRLRLDFMMGMYVSVNQITDNLNALACQQEFIQLANNLKIVKSLSFRGLRESHFPGTAFFKALASQHLQHTSMTYESGIVCLSGFNLNMLEALVYGVGGSRQQSLTRLEMGMWIGSHENVEQLLKPLSACVHLKELSLSSEDYLSSLYNPMPIDMILDACTQLVNLSLLRTAVAIEDKHSVKRNRHPLQRLTMAVSKISPEIFEYISARCRNLDSLAVENCCWMPREIEMKINMPFTTFDTLNISGLNLFYVSRLDGHLGGGRSINLFSVAQLDRMERQRKRYQHRKSVSRREETEHDIIKIPGPREDLSDWYHSYLPTSNRSVLRPTALRKLYKPEVRVLKRLAQFFRENHHLVHMTTIEEVYDDEVLEKRYWRHDVKHGYIVVVCKSIHTLQYGLNSITWPHS